MKYVFPAIFHPEPEGVYMIRFPDIGRGASQGNDMNDCIEMAEDFLCGVLYDMEENGEEIPAPTPTKNVECEPDDIVTLIAADTEVYRRFHENKLVKKTLNIPSYLNAKAEAAQVNFSALLQEALKAHLKIAS